MTDSAPSERDSALSLVLLSRVSGELRSLSDLAETLGSRTASRFDTPPEGEGEGEGVGASIGAAIQDHDHLSQVLAELAQLVAELEHDIARRIGLNDTARQAASDPSAIMARLETMKLGALRERLAGSNNTHCDDSGDVEFF